MSEKQYDLVVLGGGTALKLREAINYDEMVIVDSMT